MSFLHGGTVYPVTPATTFSLLDDLDKPLASCLRFLSLVIQADHQARFTAELTKHSLTIPGNSDGYICKSILPIDLSTEPAEFHAPFPILSLHRESETYHQRSQGIDANNATWILRFHLPSGMKFNQSVGLQPLLKGVSKSINQALNSGRHSLVNSNAKWHLNTGLISCRAERASFLSYAFSSDNLTFPTLEMVLQVEEEFQTNPDDYSPVESIDGYVYSTTADGYDLLISQILTTYT